MFDSIAPRYDLLNHVLSANVDRLWWRRAARRFRPILADPDAAVLDICCGTGDMTMALLKQRPNGAEPILAADFAPGMLSRGALKFGAPGMARRSRRPVRDTVEADALHLPLKDASLDLIVTAFGSGISPTTRPGCASSIAYSNPAGNSGILDFSEPGGLMGKAYAVYFRRVLPAIGRLICGKDGPYNYLPTSVGNFPSPQQMLELDAVHWIRRMRLATVHLRHRRVVHGQALACSLEVLNDSRRIQFAPSARARDDPRESSALKRRVARNSMVAAAAMTLLKLAAGLLSGSLGVLSDAAHSGLDMVGAALTFFSVQVSDKPADEDHTYGHGKIENLSAFCEAILMAISCGWIIWEALDRIVHHSMELHHSKWPVLVLLTSICVDYWRSRQLRAAALTTGSPALATDAFHFASDIWATLAVLAGLSANGQACTTESSGSNTLTR